MTPYGKFSPTDDIEEPLSELAWRRHEVLGKDRHPGRHADFLVVTRVVLDIRQKRRPDGVGHPVESEPGENLIAAEAPLQLPIAITPGAKFLNDPCRQACRRIRQSDGCCCWLCGLDQRVRTFAHLPFPASSEIRLLRLG